MEQIYKGRSGFLIDLVAAASRRVVGLNPVIPGGD